MSSSNHARHPHRKRWGQNFLRDTTAVRRIVEGVEARDDEMILEIGPGEGALTERLVELGRPVRLIEIDPLLVERLRSRFDPSRVEVVAGDALEVALPEVPFRAVGNLPYNVANPIIRRVLKSPHCRGALFMVQREVARRFVATPGDPDYGFLTLVTRLYAEPRIVLELGPASFFPRPRVRSAVVAFRVRKPDLVTPREVLENLVSQSFRQRRKKLVNNLNGWNDRTKSEVEQALRDAAIEPDVRAESLGLEEFDRLASLLGSPESPGS